MLNVRFGCADGDNFCEGYRAVSGLKISLFFFFQGRIYGGQKIVVLGLTLVISVRLRYMTVHSVMLQFVCEQKTGISRQSLPHQIISCTC